MTPTPILVIGATGKTGARVAARLEAMNRLVRHGTRSALIPFDWEKRETWAPVLEGIESAYVTYFPDLAFPGAVDKVAAFCATAKASGLKHIVLLSGRGEHHARLGEDAVCPSGIDFTLVRSSSVAQHFYQGYLRDPILADTLPMPVCIAKEPIIDLDHTPTVVVSVQN